MAPRDRRLPRAQERHALQQLLSGEWKAGHELQPSGIRTLTAMVTKRSLEERRTPQPEYKITPSGRSAFSKPLPHWNSMCGCLDGPIPQSGDDR